MKSGQPWEPQQIVAFLDGKGEDKAHPEMMNISKNDDHALKFLRSLPKPTLNACLVIAARNVGNENCARNCALLVAAGANNLGPLSNISKNQPKKDQYLNYLAVYRASDSNVPAISKDSQPRAQTQTVPQKTERKTESKTRTLYNIVNATAPDQVGATTELIIQSEHRNAAYLLAATEGDLWACYLLQLGGAQHNGVKEIFNASSAEAKILVLMSQLKDLGTSLEVIKELSSFSTLTPNNLAALITKFNLGPLTDKPNTPQKIIYNKIYNELKDYQTQKFKPIKFEYRELFSISSLFKPIVYAMPSGETAIVTGTTASSNQVRLTLNTFSLNGVRNDPVENVFYFIHPERIQVDAYPTRVIYFYNKFDISAVVLDLNKVERSFKQDYSKEHERHRADCGSGFSVTSSGLNSFMANPRFGIAHYVPTNYPVRSLCTLNKATLTSHTALFAILEGSSVSNMRLSILNFSMNDSYLDLLNNKTKIIPVPNAAHIVRLNDTQLMTFCNPPGLVVVDVEYGQSVRLNIDPWELRYDIGNLQVSNIDPVTLLFLNGDEYVVLNCNTQILEPIGFPVHHPAPTNVVLTSEGSPICCSVLKEQDKTDSYTVFMERYQKNFWILKCLSESIPDLPVVLHSLVLDYWLDDSEFNPRHLGKVGFFAQAEPILPNKAYSDAQNILKTLLNYVNNNNFFYVPDIFPEYKHMLFKVDSRVHAISILKTLQEKLLSAKNKDDFVARLLAAHEYLIAITGQVHKDDKQLSTVLAGTLGNITKLIQKLGAGDFLPKADVQVSGKRLK